ncbi:hypothetical protein [Desertibacillus haloalkaliphilus]|uniref:hypothetical protein n=1 Tax=Desertibacillus haloalkaliphilus TaxID=1328930 RepID=UPI001C272F8C|nr:hypothetical protein [Desertibacillus haloalkaliphilus]MBU8905703.1 hypothetical protein [Desertibacillus haloalkaliphilus]
MADNRFENDERSLELEREERDLNEERDFTEETAAEVTPTGPIGVVGDREEREETEAANVDDETAGRGVGTFAIVLSILSLFFLPVLLGAAGIVVGFISRRNGASALGNWAIGIGAVSIIMTVFFSPFF